MSQVARTDRISVLMQREISDIINNDLKDPRLEGLIVSITRVDVTRDLRHAKVMVSIFGQNEKKCADCFSAIEKASGFIRRETGARIDLRVTPELHFIRDGSIEYGVRMSQYIDDVLHGDQAPETEQ